MATTNSGACLVAGGCTRSSGATLRKVRVDPLHTRACVIGPPLGCDHRGRLLLVLHVSQLDQDRRVLRKIQPCEVCATVEAVAAPIGRRREARGDNLVTHDLCEPNAEPDWASLSGGFE